MLLAATACGSGGAKKTTTGGGNSNAVFTSIDANNAITAGAPMNPYNASANSFLGYNTMELGFDKKNPTDPSDFFPGIGATWTSAPGALTVHLQPDAKWSDGTPVTPDDVKMSLALASPRRGFAGSVTGHMAAQRFSRPTAGTVWSTCASTRR